MMNISKRILKNFTYLSVSGILTNLFAFISIIYLARRLGVEDFGKINFTVAVLTYFTLLVNMGLPLLGTREVARSKERINEYTTNIITLRGILSCITFLLLTLFVVIINKPLEIKSLILIYGLSLFSSVFLLDWVFQGIEKMEYISLARILTNGLYLVFIVAFIKSSRQLLGIPLIFLISQAFGVLFLILVFFRLYRYFNFFSFNPPFWRELLMHALPMGFSSMMILIYINFDTIMLGFMKSNAEVGYYSAAYKIVWFVHGFAAAFYTTIFPVVSYYYKASIEILSEFMHRILKLMVTVALPLAVGGTILAKPLMNLLYGAQYDNGIIALQILIWSIAIIYVSSVYGNALPACDRQSFQALGVTAGATTNLVLNFILIPPFGIIGASIATVISEIVVFAIMYREFNKILKLNILNYLFRPFLASVLMGFILFWLLQWNVLLLIPIGLIVYFGALYLTGGLTREEIRLVFNLVFERRV